MINFDKWSEKIFKNLDNIEFNNLAIEAFRFQSSENLVYKQFLQLNKVDINKISNYKEIPFLPIEFFKNHIISCFREVPKYYFESSGTTSINKSKHFFNSIELYEKSFSSGFEFFMGNIQDYIILALLPNYKDQKHSSLIHMVDNLIKRTNNELSDFYLEDFTLLSDVIDKALNLEKKIILFGVSYAILDFSFYNKKNYNELLVFETGGMKGKRKEMLRVELHDIIKKSLGVSNIYGEYGMAELFSQAYSKSNGLFKCPPWMKVLIRETNDPRSQILQSKAGGVNIIDLANIQTCCFIATQDIGISYYDESFEILGRLDNSDIRGCNTMITN